MLNPSSKGLIPDVLQRVAVRALCKERIRGFPRGSLEDVHAAKMKWIEDARSRSSIAEHTDKANQQHYEVHHFSFTVPQSSLRMHYEVPTDFIISTLGPRAKYSACLFPTGRETLAQAEEAMLALYCERAQLDDGMSILDLGCGWGSLCLYLAEVSITNFSPDKN
jgi:cyclopropane fatty-acyl-phospholipid synthase-like methyltransferase